MGALIVNASVHQFEPEQQTADNADMHKKRRETPLGKLMASYQGGEGIGDNELARQLKLRGSPVPQSTITRIANGTTKESKEAQLRPLAEFFGVTTAVLRGEAPPPKGKAARVATSDLSEEAVGVARGWMRLSPGRRMQFQMEIWWANFFESKFPTYRLGVAKDHASSHDKFERSVEADWERMMRQAKLPLEGAD